MESKFGECIRDEFLLDRSGIFLNHGSYGVVPRRVFNKQMRLKEEMETHPDSWYRRTNIVHYRENLRLLCELINSQYKNTVFVENVTFGINSVVQSLDWTADDVIVLSNLTYHAVVVLAKAIHSKFGTTIKYVNLDFPVESEDQVVETYRQMLETTHNIKLVIIDHISSPTSILLPVKKLVDLCHQYDVMVMVDGAHALGHVSIDVTHYNADFYSGNLHKWLFTPRPSGYLWIHTDHISKIKPAVVSHFHGNQLHYDFCVRGTRDDTPYYTLGEALAFIKDIGGQEAIHSYSTRMLDNVIDDLEKSWHTSRFSLPPSMTAPYLRLIKVPDMVNYPKTPAGGKAIEDVMYSRFGIQLLCAHLPDGENYMRISGFVYNSPNDYVRLREGLIELMNEPKRESNQQTYQLALMHWELQPLDN